jgi:hypothetical protein
LIKIAIAHAIITERLSFLLSLNNKYIIGLAEKLENTRKNKKIGEQESLRVFSRIPKTYVFGISHIKWLFSNADN